MWGRTVTTSGPTFAGMAPTHPPPQTPATGSYEIRVKGRLDDRWTAWFDGLSLTHDTDGTTLIRGSVPDQAALHGLLHKLRDIGLPLVSVTQADPDQPTPAQPWQPEDK
jgi:hypothetical protein